MDRRVFLGAMSTVLLGIGDPHKAFAKSFNKIYREIKIVVLHAKISGDEEIFGHIHIDGILDDAAIYVRDSVIWKRPKIEIVALPYKSNTAFSEFPVADTFFALIHLNIRKITSEIPNVNGYIGAIGIEYNKENRINGIALHPCEPFVTADDKELLNAGILSALKTMLDRGIVTPLVTVPWTY